MFFHWHLEIDKFMNEGALCIELELMQEANSLTSRDTFLIPDY